MTGTGEVYGKALFDLALEENKLNEYMQELTGLREITAMEPQLITLLETRAVPLDERLQVIETCFGGKIQNYILSFMKILCQNNAIRRLEDCIRQFELLYNEHCGIVEVHCVSAVALTSDQRDKLTRKLENVTGKTISIRCTVDARVLGGIRLELMGKEMDGTVRRRLDEIAKNLAELTI